MRNRTKHVVAALLVCALAPPLPPPMTRAQNMRHQSADDVPDIIITNFQDLVNYGYVDTPSGPVSGFAVGPHFCNIGNAPVRYEIISTQHPVFRQSMFRLLNGRFEQIGTSWVFHPFAATNEPLCGMECAPEPADVLNLYPGCADVHSGSIVGTRSQMGAASQMNAHTGSFSNPIIRPAAVGMDGRLQVHNADLDPALNPGALYFLEGHVIAPDDAAAANGNNNASYHPVTIIRAADSPSDACTGTDPQKYCLSLAGSPAVSHPAIRAWKQNAPTVVETDVQIPGEGLFILAAKVTDLQSGYWRYEYALQNVNSDRSASSFSVPFAPCLPALNVGFHGVDYHSGEPYSLTDWETPFSPYEIKWSTEDFSANENANALRWSTLYNFRFDTNVPPGPNTVTIRLFKPGSPDALLVNTMGPVFAFPDCNNNGVADLCDAICDPDCCDHHSCGVSDDCNRNAVPDECEPDCNENGIADSCDMRPQGKSLDCNMNGVPDECEDCKRNGVADDCESLPDTDEDGFDDCQDRCPAATPASACLPPDAACCHLDAIEVSFFPSDLCMTINGIPYCNEQDQGACGPASFPCPSNLCHQGCIVGDTDGDSDLDLLDLAGFLHCWTDSATRLGNSSVDCPAGHDFNGDASVDWNDLFYFEKSLSGPD